MDCKKSLWKDRYVRYDFEFEGRGAILVLPREEKKNGRWLLKTEYFDAFQELEEEMVARGFHLAYLENMNRWGRDEDQDAKLRFRDLLVKEFGLSEKCIPIGMSCGGLHAVKLAARHPEMVEKLYLDAPVINLLSCPFSAGMPSDIDESVKQEALDALGLTMSEMIAYREHPLDKLGDLVRARIPVALVWGDADTTVPYEENGHLLKAAYDKTDIPALYVCKPDCGHHPHGPITEADMAAVTAFLNGREAVRERE